MNSCTSILHKRIPCHSSDGKHPPRRLWVKVAQVQQKYPENEKSSTMKIQEMSLLYWCGQRGGGLELRKKTTSTMMQESSSRLIVWQWATCTLFSFEVFMGQQNSEV